ncbi:MAG: M36 family metallopeptidase, partial [Planctomycetota bacterium]
MRLEILETRQLLAAGVSPDTSTHLENEIGWWRESQHFTPGQETRVERVGTTKDDVHVPAAIISYLNEWLPDVDFSLVDHQYGLDSEHFYFHQTISGLAVAGSAISVHLNDDGTLQSSHGIVYTADQSTSKAGPQKAENELVEKIHHHNRVEQVGSTPIVNQVWHIDAYGNRHLAFQVDQLTLAPLAEYRTWIDPISGSILGKVDRLTKANGTGRVFDPNPYQSRGSGAGLSDNNDANSAALNSELISVVLPRLDDNTGLLRGEWVDLATLNTSNNGVSTVDSNEPDRIYQYTRDDPRFEQVMIYYHIDAVQAYIHSLGFDDDVGIANGIRDFPTLANAHWYTEDNSFYSLSNDAIHFGDGGVDDAEDADIILHEYGHAIQFDQNPFWGGGDMGAMGEGFSDYLAASFFAEAGDDSYQSSDVACVGEWDATSYSNTNPPCLRRVDGNKVYPDDLIGQVHADGEIWSAALWDLRGRIGGVATDQLVLEHHFSLPANATMRQAAQAILDVDQSLNGGTNTAEILAAFTPRGLIAATSAAVIEFDRDTYAIDDEVLIEVRDLDLTGQSSISVTVSTDAGDIETVTLTSSSSSTFVGGIALASSASPTRQDGTLESTVPGRLTAVYLDADDGTGSTINVDTTATVNESTDLFFADFTDANGNATDGGFTLSGSANQWHLTSRRDGDAGHSGPHSFHFGDNNPTAVNPQYSNDQFGTITSPEIDLSEMASAELRFNHYLETEPGFDFATVSVISGSQSFILAESDSELPTFTSG